MIVQTIQIRADRRLRHSTWNTALCMVKLDDTRTRVKKPARSDVELGARPAARARPCWPGW